MEIFIWIAMGVFIVGVIIFVISLYFNTDDDDDHDGGFDPHE